jgi:hypothetical protein
MHDTAHANRQLRRSCAAISSDTEPPHVLRAAPSSCCRACATPRSSPAAPARLIRQAIHGTGKQACPATAGIAPPASPQGLGAIVRPSPLRCKLWQPPGPVRIQARAGSGPDPGPSGCPHGWALAVQTQVWRGRQPGLRKGARRRPSESGHSNAKRRYGTGGPVPGADAERIQGGPERGQWRQWQTRMARAGRVHVAVSGCARAGVGGGEGGRERLRGRVPKP